jgi:hypothetical protein
MNMELLMTYMLVAQFKRAGVAVDALLAEKMITDDERALLKDMAALMRGETLGMQVMGQTQVPFNVFEAEVGDAVEVEDLTDDEGDGGEAQASKGEAGRPGDRSDPSEGQD